MGGIRLSEGNYICVKRYVASSSLPTIMHSQAKKHSRIVPAPRPTARTSEQGSAVTYLTPCFQILQHYEFPPQRGRTAGRLSNMLLRARMGRLVLFSVYLKATRCSSVSHLNAAETGTMLRAWQ